MFVKLINRLLIIGLFVLINSLVLPPGVLAQVDFEVQWEFSDREGTVPGWFSENDYPRGGGFGIVDGKKRLVFPVRDGARFHDAEDGSHIRDLSMTGLKESLFDVNVADFTDDGKIIAAGLTTDNTGTNPFNVHMWDDPDSDPVNIISYDGGTGHRLGDQFNVAGSYGDGTAKVIAATPGHPYIYVFSMKDGSFDDENPEIIEIDEEGLSGDIGSNANAYPVGDDQWLYNTNGIVPALLNADGTVAGNTAKGVVGELSNNIKVVKEDGDTFYYIVGLPNPDGNVNGQARLQYVRVPDGNMDKAETIGVTPSLGDVENRDERIAVDYHYDEIAGHFDFYVIEINNGIARFQTTDTPFAYTTLFERALAYHTYPDWLGGGTTERGMAAYDESVYIISRDGLNLLEVESQSGELSNTTPVTGAEGGTFDLNDIGVSKDGVLYTANLTTNASSNAFRVYELDAATGEATEVIVFEDGGRLGDKITVAGAKNDGSLAVYAGDQNNNRILTWEWNNNGQAFGEAKEIILSEDITGSNVSVTPRSDGSFYWNAIGHYPRKFDGDGELIGVFPDEVVPDGSNALSYLGHDGEYDYLIIYLSAVDYGNLSLVRIPKHSVEGAEELSRTRPLRVTGSAGRGDVSFISRQNGDVDLFVLTSNNALAGYEYHIDGLSEIETLARSITGEAGWRMVTMPVEGITVQDLAGQNLVQGISGANDFYTAHNEIEFEADVAPNLVFFDPDDEESDENGWVAPADFNAEFSSGQGFIWYFWDNDTGPSVPLDGFTLQATGVTPRFDVSVDVNSHFNLIGNPFSDNLDVTGLSGWGDETLASTVAQVWDNSGDDVGDMQEDGHTGTWRQLGDTGTDGDRVAAWQGFVVENQDSESSPAGTVTIPVANATEDAAPFYKESAPAYHRLSFELRGDNQEAGIRTLDRAASVVFHPDATHEWDIHDASKLTPLADNYATLAFPGSRNGREVLKSQESRPVTIDGELEIPMAFDTHNMGGDFAISWNDLENIPEEWELTLIDHVEGIAVDLRENGVYEFVYHPDEPAKKVSGSEPGLPQITPMPFRAKNVADDEATDDETATRFTIIVSDEPLSAETDADLPEELELAQNYPNPFNPATKIGFSLPEQTHVKLTVYDMLGREVAVLVDESRAAGHYHVNWDASRYASGVYVYRLQAGDQSITRRMTFVK